MISMLERIHSKMMEDVRKGQLYKKAKKCAFLCNVYWLGMKPRRAEFEIQSFLIH